MNIARSRSASVLRLVAGALQPKIQPDEFSLRNINHMASAVADLNSFEALEQ